MLFFFCLLWDIRADLVSLTKQGDLEGVVGGFGVTPVITFRSIASAVANCKQSSPHNNASVMMTVASLIVSVETTSV